MKSRRRSNETSDSEESDYVPASLKRKSTKSKSPGMPKMQRIESVRSHKRLETDIDMYNIFLKRASVFLDELKSKNQINNIDDSVFEIMKNDESFLNKTVKQLYLIHSETLLKQKRESLQRFLENENFWQYNLQCIQGLMIDKKMEFEPVIKVLRKNLFEIIARSLLNPKLDKIRNKILNSPNYKLSHDDCRKIINNLDEDELKAHTNEDIDLNFISYNLDYYRLSFIPIVREVTDFKERQDNSGIEEPYCQSITPNICKCENESNLIFQDIDVEKMSDDEGVNNDAKHQLTSNVIPAESPED